jgi:hypothetical protein
MSVAQSPTINGSSIFTSGVSINTTSPLLSWTAPTGLTPIGYSVNVGCADDTCWNNAPAKEGTVYTASTSVTIPPGLLSPGYNYTFAIYAMADARANIESSPFRSGYPSAQSYLTSATFQIASGATSVPVTSERQPRAAAAHAAKSHTTPRLLTRYSWLHDPMAASSRSTTR